MRQKYEEGACTSEAVDALESMIRPLGLALLRQTDIPKLSQPLYVLLKEIKDSEHGTFGVTGTAATLGAILAKSPPISTPPGAHTL